MASVLVLGEKIKGLSVESFSWEKIPSNLNLGNYDRVILNTTTLPDQIADEVFDKLPSIISVLEYLAANKELVLIVNEPEFQYRGDRQFKPIIPGWFIPRLRDTKNLAPKTGPYEPYLKQVSAAQYFFTENWEWASKDMGKLLALLGPHYSGLAIELEDWCANPSNQSVAGSFQYIVRMDSGREFDFGRVTVLPALSSRPSESVAVLLSEVIGTEATEEEPEWCKKYRLPSQESAQKSFNAAQEAHEKAGLELEQKAQELSYEQKYSRLLYAQGSTSLEPIVRLALEKLGAKVDFHEEKYKDDGRITVGKNRGVLEIKGLKGTATRGNVRQAAEWRTLAVEEEERDVRAILIVNGHAGVPVRDREGTFPDDVLKSAELQKVSCLTTTQVFQALLEWQTGKFDKNSFWGKTFKTDGLVSVKDL